MKLARFAELRLCEIHETSGARISYSGLPKTSQHETFHSTYDRNQRPVSFRLWAKGVRGEGFGLRGEGL